MCDISFGFYFMFTKLFTTETFLTVLPNLTTPGEHHCERKQNQNRKRIENKHFSPLCHHTFEILFLLLFLMCLLAFLHPNYNADTNNIDNFLRHRIIVNIFSMKQVMPKPPFTQTLPYFFLINSLKSISNSNTFSSTVTGSDEFAQNIIKQII